jgi:hypothetical protein
MPNNKRSRKTCGGSAWQFTEAVYGAADKQLSAPQGGNVIAAANMSGKNFCSGGGKKRRRRNGGTGLLAEVAVPAVLLYANNSIKFAKSFKKRNGKSKRTRRYNRK